MANKRLSGLGPINYRNIGLSFATGVLIEMGKELIPHCKQAKLIQRTIDDIGELLKMLPDALYDKEVEIACEEIFAVMEAEILRHVGYEIITDDLYPEDFMP